MNLPPHRSNVTGLLSIVWRELAVGSRQIGTQRSRLIAGGAVVLFFAVFVLLQRQPPNALGMMIFSIGSALLFLQAWLAGVRYTADAISEEKRDGTLGLLYLTELRSHEIVLGKMAVRSVRAFYSLIATLPLFTFCILLGGVQGSVAVQTAVLLLTTLFYSLAAGIFVSSRTTEDKSAFLGTITLLIALSAVPPLLWKILTLTGWKVVDWLLCFSPFYAFHVAGGPMKGEFLLAIAILNLTTFALLTMAARRLALCARNDFVEPKTSEQPLTPSARKRPGSRSVALLEENPFRWLLKRELLYPKIAVAFAIAGLLLPTIGYALVKQYGPGIYSNIGINGLYALHVLWKFLVASDALRRLHHDRRSGALEQLLVTPLSPQQIIHAQVENTFLLFVPGAICLAIGNFIFFQSTFVNGMAAIPIGGAFFLFMDARTLCWRAVLQALSPTRYPLAILRVVGLTLIPPLLVILLILWSGRGFSSSEGNLIFALWFVACGIYDLILIHRAKMQLRAHFRDLAAESAQPAAANRRPLPRPVQWLLLLEPARSPRP